MNIFSEKLYNKHGNYTCSCEIGLRFTVRSKQKALKTCWVTLRLLVDYDQFLFCSAKIRGDEHELRKAQALALLTTRSSRLAASLSIIADFRAKEKLLAV